jgi:threonine dehydrogenase-like Zn-dependent dehydrogenase
MKAIYWDGHELTLDSSYPPPVPEQNTAIVKVHLAGVCSTDLQIFKGYMKFRGVPGHEFVGSVREGPQEWLRKRVVGEINFGCGKCEFCARDLSRHCPNRHGYFQCRRRVHRVCGCAGRKPSPGAGFG